MFRKKKSQDYDEYLDYDFEIEENPDELAQDEADKYYDPYGDHYDENDYLEDGYYDNNTPYQTPLEDDIAQENYDERAGIHYVNESEFTDEPLRSRSQVSEDNEEEKGQRTKYNAKIDRFLNNGIIIVGVLLIIVLVIAFML